MAHAAYRFHNSHELLKIVTERLVLKTLLSVKTAYYIILKIFRFSDVW